ncbi:MAG TPA: DNA polymerase III subunit gamma/tau [Anaerolineae bacterium]|nr:DNA polymerase III subunit gamma/tau [Anaerolineae bacterium]HNU05320.1 DNA polymerase III subunit gamma/tau [Anaerolineae bacterium]
MAAQALYRRWRSQTFDEVVGQEHVTQTLRNALRDGRMTHAYLFAGPRGTGKTSTARLLAKAVNCDNPDVSLRPDNSCPICLAITSGALLDLIEIDAASNRGIDEIRDLRDKVHFSPSQARFKVYVIDEVHMLTPEAFNALLKTLEEPPPHVIFVLATTEPHKIPDTVLSRCQRFDFRRIPTHRIVERLSYILEQEGRAAEPAALEMIARSAEGGMRDAISLMDQLLSYGGDVITEQQVQAVRGAISGQAISQMVDFLAAGDVASGLGLINGMAEEGIDLRQLALQLVAYLRTVLVSRVGGQQARAILVDLSDAQLAAVQAQAKLVDPVALTGAVRLLNQASQEMREAAQPQLTLELAWLDAAARVAAPADVQPAPVSSQPAQPAAWQSRPLPSSAPAASPPAASAPAVSPSHARPAGPQATTPVPDQQVVDLLRSQWTALLQAAEEARGASLRGALRTLRNVVALGDDIYFAFEHDLSRQVVERPNNKTVVENLISQLLGRRVHIHCQVGSQVTGIAAAARPERVERNERGGEAAPAAADDLTTDPVVRHAQQALGAVASKL